MSYKYECWLTGNRDDPVVIEANDIDDAAMRFAEDRQKPKRPGEYVFVSVMFDGHEYRYRISVELVPVYRTEQINQ